MLARRVVARSAGVGEAAQMDPQRRNGAGVRLRRELGGLETWALSIGVLAPALAMSIAGVEPAKLLGRAAPISFLLAAVAVGFFCYGFLRPFSPFSPSGAVYEVNRRTPRRRARFWARRGLV